MVVSRPPFGLLFLHRGEGVRMSRTGRSRATGVLAALGALVAALLVVVASPSAVSALPGDCTTTFNVVTGNWSSNGNWTGGLPTGSSVACIPSGRTATLSSGAVHVAKLHIDGALTVSGASLFVDSSAPSVWDGPVLVDHGTIGGTGLIHVHDFVDFTGGSVLSSIPGGPGTAWNGQHGTMDIAGAGTPEGLGTVTVDDSALSLRTSFAIGIFGDMVVQSDGFVTADWGTGTSVAGGRLELNGDGGYYQGSPVDGRTVGSLFNNGTIAKTGGGSTSIVDAAYTQSATGALEVDCCATLAFAGGQVVSGKVQPSMSLGTGACGAGTTSICNGSVDPAVDPSSVVLKLSGNDGNSAAVQVQELALPAATTDSRAIGNEVYAHADGLVGDPTQPATITLRFSQADVMSTPLAEVQVGHISDSGVMTKTPDCVGNNLPSGAPYCVVRPVTRTAQNTFVTVLTTQTSRWRLRRTGAGENFDQAAPGVPSGFSAAKASPFDGSAIGLSWQPPASDGGAAVTAYRVYRDGVLVATTGGASALVKDSGPGKHVFAVAAVNGLGESVRASAEITLAKMSKPRKLTTIRGKKGGKKTAGVKWKAPASAGGLTLTGYQVKVLTASGRKVKVKAVSAGKHRYVLKLKPGRYVFKVRARNATGYGPWSKATKPVRPR